MSNEDSNDKLHNNSLDYLFPPETVVLDDGEELVVRHVRIPDTFSTEFVTEDQEFKDILRLLRSTEVRGQLLRVYSSGYGGETHLGQRLINAVKSTAATISIVIDGHCYSMHTIFALALAEHIEIEEGVEFMLHEVQTMTELGGLENAHRDVKHTQRINNHVIKYQKPYMTKEELHELKTGRDVYITGKEMKKRIDKKFKRGKKKS
jgi:ATP-dependent protease ClpP protease subunit